nr:ABC transporter ATP-binding protein [Chryseolinea sp.]
MRIFFRVLEYSNNLISKLIQFFVYSILGTVFGLITFAVAMPLIEALFDKANVTKISPLPSFELSTGYAIDAFNHFYTKTVMQYGKVDALLFICVCIIASTLLSSVFKYLERVIASQMRVNVVNNLRAEIFSKITRLQISYFNTNRKGDLISRFTGDVQEIESTVINSLKTILKEPVTIVIYFAAMFFISVKLTLFALIVLPIVGGVLGGIVKRLKKKAKLSQESLGRIVNILDETFSGMRVIKAFNARNYILTKMGKENDHYSKVNLSMAYKNELASPVSELLGVLIVTIIMYFGGSLILSGESELSAKAFIGFLLFFSQIIQPAKTFSNGITSIQKGIASARRIFTVIDTEPIIENKPNAIVLDTFEKNIEFKNVSFAYDTELVLKNINLTVEKGKTIALVGSSGGGKSTLADLVPRFYDPTNGDVCIDGVSLRDYEIESLRKQMGVVTQESILFNDSIFNNIAF